MGVRFGVGPNGQFGPVFVMDEPPAVPQQYYTWFQTPAGIQVDIQFRTDNKVLADQYEADMAQQLGWTILDAPVASAAKSGFWADLATAWGAAIVLAFLLPAIGFFGSIVLQSAGYLDWQTSNAVIDYMPKLGVWTFPLSGMLFTIFAIITNWPRKQHG